MPDADVPVSDPSSGTAVDLAAVMGELARSLAQEHTVEDVLQAITHAALDNIPGAQAATVTLTAKGTLEVRAATSETARRIDNTQNDVGEGPCLSAIENQSTTRVGDLERDGRWPTWSAKVSELGVHSMLCFYLTTGRELGALNLYGENVDAFDPYAEDIGTVFAAHAAVALAGSLEVAQLRIALDHRDTIGQAKGILMERYNLSSDAAFNLLVRASQSTHMKLHDVAARVAQRD